MAGFTWEPRVFPISLQLYRYHSAYQKLTICNVAAEESVVLLKNVSALERTQSCRGGCSCRTAHFATFNFPRTKQCVVSARHAIPQLHYLAHTHAHNYHNTPSNPYIIASEVPSASDRAWLNHQRMRETWFRDPSGSGSLVRQMQVARVYCAAAYGSVLRSVLNPASKYVALR